jgi:hypothetical protein
MFGHKQQPVLRHGVLHALKEVPAEIGRVAVLVVGALIAAVEKIPIRVADVFAQRPAEGDAGLSTLRRSWRIFLRFSWLSDIRKSSKLR